MNHKAKVVAGVGAALIAMRPAAAVAADAPDLVAAYAQQLARQCGGQFTPAASAQLTDRVDLDGDKVADWVVDASRYSCPSRSPAATAAGSQVTVFRGFADGRALPAFQRMAFGARLEGKPETGYALWLTLGGNDCGDADPKARCDRRVVWRPKEQRFDLADTSVKGAPAGTR